MKDIFVQLRLILAETMFGWALRIAPKDDPDGARIVQTVAAYFQGFTSPGDHSAAGELTQHVRLDFVPQDGFASNYFDCTATAADGSAWYSRDGVWLAQRSPL
jgi:hypothetical protein